MRITLFGAAGEVTGSAYLVTTAQARVLVDFGMFQGGRDDEARNVVPDGLDPRRLDAVAGEWQYGWRVRDADPEAAAVAPRRVEE